MEPDILDDAESTIWNITRKIDHEFHEQDGGHTKHLPATWMVEQTETSNRRQKLELGLPAAKEVRHYWLGPIRLDISVNAEGIHNGRKSGIYAGENGNVISDTRIEILNNADIEFPVFRDVHLPKEPQPRHSRTYEPEQPSIYACFRELVERTKVIERERVAQEIEAKRRVNSAMAFVIENVFEAHSDINFSMFGNGFFYSWGLADTKLTSKIAPFGRNLVFSLSAFEQKPEAWGGISVGIYIHDDFEGHVRGHLYQCSTEYDKRFVFDNDIANGLGVARSKFAYKGAVLSARNLGTFDILGSPSLPSAPNMEDFVQFLHHAVSRAQLPKVET